LEKKETKREGKERKLKEEASDKATGVSTKVVKFRSTILSLSSYDSAIFGEIISIPNSCAPNHVVAIQDL
jgi:hypothetical protein